MEDFLNRTTEFFVNRVAPLLPCRGRTIDPAGRAELERQALDEIEARISRGRPGPEEWHRGVRAAKAPKPRSVSVPRSLRPRTVSLPLLPPPRTTPEADPTPVSSPATKA